MTELKYLKYVKPCDLVLLNGNTNTFFKNVCFASESFISSNTFTHIGFIVNNKNIKTIKTDDLHVLFCFIKNEAKYLKLYKLEEILKNYTNDDANFLIIGNDSLRSRETDITSYYKKNMYNLNFFEEYFLLCCCADSIKISIDSTFIFDCYKKIGIIDNNMTGITNITNITNITDVDDIIEFMENEYYFKKLKP